MMKHRLLTLLRLIPSFIVPFRLTKSIAKKEKQDFVISRVFLFLLLGLIFILSTLLFLPVLQWMLVKMSLANGYLHSIALLSLAVLGIYRATQLKQALFHVPIFLHRGLFVWLFAGLAYLWNEANVGFHTLSAALFLLYLYGVSAHFIADKHWKAMLLPLLLTLLVLPFEHYLDVYLGFPLRLLSAEWAASVLQLTQLPLVTVESILMIDNKAAIVDLDCSGINSLWIGLIFYLLLTWIERYRINLRWFLLGLGFVGLLVLANVFRIVLLVLVDLVLELPDLAQLFHQSLGLLGFVSASLLVWWGLNHFGTQLPVPAVESILETVSKPTQQSSLYAASFIAVVLGTFLFLYQPFHLPQQQAITHQFVLPTAYPMSTTKMSQQETTFFVNNHAQAEKYTIQKTIAGKPVIASMVLVWSRAWKAHHVPENCYISQGYSLTDKSVWQLKQEKQSHHLRHLSLTPPNLSSSPVHQSGMYSGVYWFQSKTRSTPDYSSRVMDNLLHTGEEWVMVSILWETTVTPEEIKDFTATVQRAITHQFQENNHENK